MPPAARIADFHTCPMVNPGPVPHVGGPVASGSPDVIIGFMPAARKTDTAICVPAVDAIKKGSSGVVINNLDAARIGDPTNHNGVIVMGCPTVIIGEKAQAVALKAAAKDGKPFCEECEKAKAAQEEVKRQQQGIDPLPAPVETPPADAKSPADSVPYHESSLAHVELSREALAAQPNQDDGLDGARYAARESLAREFYEKHKAAWETAADIDSHIRCIDLEEPVRLVTAPPDGQGMHGDQLYQRGFPGGGDGRYFTTSQDTLPEEVGAYGKVVCNIDGCDVIQPRDYRTITFDEPVQGLMSTAAPANDHWSMNTSARSEHNRHRKETGGELRPGMSKRTKGGATQIMIPPQLREGKTHTVVSAGRY